MGVVMDISHRVMVLDFGRRIALGLPEEVLADPHVRRSFGKVSAARTRAA
jgi:branched-chain amino acid transport system ATP-binding protein